MNKFLEEPSLSIQGNRHIALHIFVSYTVKTKVLLTFWSCIVISKKRGELSGVSDLIVKGTVQRDFRPPV